MTIKKKISELRDQLRKANLDAYIIPGTDPHSGEYIPDHWQARKWISGFTGSAGTFVITEKIAGLWTDSRYFIQAEKELKNTGIDLIKMKIPHFPCYMDWIGEKLPEGSIVGLDKKVYSVSNYSRLESILAKKNISIGHGIDLIDPIWKNRPQLPDSQVYLHDIKYAGRSAGDKILMLRSKMKEISVTHHLITTLDDIAWLFNIRGADIEFNPVVVSYALISEKKGNFIYSKEKDIC